MKSSAAVVFTALVLLTGVVGPLGADPVPIQLRLAPAFAEGEWVNGRPTTISSQKGRVVILLFWTRDCVNCKNNLGYWNDWARKYANTDVTVLSIHTPETRFERSPGATARFARQHGLLFPIAIDNDEKIWNAYGIESWPTEVLVDKRGRIRAEYAGELNWQGSHEERVVTAKIEDLRMER